MRLTSKMLEKVAEAGRRYLLEDEAKTVCMEHDIPVTRFKLAKTEVEAVEAAEEMGYPVVLKVVSPDINHKSDFGGVILNLKNSSEVQSAYKHIFENVKAKKKEAKIVGVLVQEMAPPSTEVIVGSIKDPQFGHALMFGLGGVFVEVLKDITFRITPITEAEAREMITKLRHIHCLEGTETCHQPI